MNFREAEIKDKKFILNANKEINVLSGLNDSTFEKRIDKDLFEDKICKSIIAENDGEVPEGVFDEDGNPLEANQWYFDDDPYKIVYYEYPNWDLEE